MSGHSPTGAAADPRVGPVVDTDVHLPIPTTADLLPHLAEHWRSYLGWTSFTARAPGQVFPAWSGLSPGRSGDRPHEQVRADLDRDVFGSCSAAVAQTYLGVEAVQHPDLAPDLASAANSWLRSTWLDPDPRLLGAGMVTPQFADAAAAEVRRLADTGRFAQVVLPARATEPYGHRRYWPIWEAAAATGLVVAITASGAVPSPGNAVNWLETFFEEYATGTQPFQTHVTSMIMNGVFDRWPSLRVVLAGSGWSWLPALCWRMDAEWKANRQEVPWVREAPSAYVRRHLRLTAQPADVPDSDPHLERLLHQLGFADMLMYSSDFPRTPTSSFARVLAALTVEEREKVVWGNAAALYEAALPATLPAAAP